MRACAVLLVSVFLAISGLAAPAPEPEVVQADENTLKDAKIGVDGPALLRFFKERTLPEPLRAKVRGLIVKLGDDSFDVREQATADLQVMGGLAVADLLRQAISMPEADVEVMRRAEKVLAELKVPGVGVTCAAARLLGARKPAGSAEVLLAYFPFAADDSVTESLRSSLVRVAVPGGKPEPALLKALDDPLAARRSAAVEALIRAGGADQRAGLRKFLKDPDDTVRLRSALGFAEAKDKTAIPVLIDLLKVLPPDRAWPAEELLCRLGGEQTPQVPLGANAAARQKCRDAWAEWWTKNEASVDLARLDETQRLLGFTVLTLMDNNGVGKVVELGLDGKPRWTISGFQYPVDARVVRQDRVLIAEYNGQRVTERDFKGEVKWEKRVPVPISAQRLANGQTFIACQNQLLVVDQAGKELLQVQRPNHDVVAATRLRDGQMLVITNRGVGVRLDAAGKELKSFNVGQVNQFVGMDVLPNGKVLVPQTWANRVVELDADGKTGWSANVPNPTSAMRLPNGNTLVASFNTQRVVEVDTGGKVVKEFPPEARPWKAWRR